MWCRAVASVMLTVLVTTQCGWSAAHASESNLDFVAALDERLTDRRLTHATVRRSSSFVAPTRGSAHALTLTTYLTDAAELHYAAVLSGHQPLESTAIKGAARQCTDTEMGAFPAVALPDDITQASTVAVGRAQKVERLLTGLQANTSYDVYLVTEVPNSNGVFGPVLSVMGSTTHPTFPVVAAASASSVNGSVSSAVANLTLMSPGLVHMAFVPTSEAVASQLLFTAQDVVSRSDRGVGVIFATEKRFRWDSLSMLSTVDGLAPASEYHMLLVTEALGGGGVFSDLIALNQAVQTHAAAPDVATIACQPTKGSSSSLDVFFSLHFTPSELMRVSQATLNRYKYQLHYEVRTTLGADQNESHGDTMRGVFSFSTFGTVAQMIDEVENDLVHNRTIGGLDPGVAHAISLFAETVDSHGVVGKSQSVDLCRTHALAPDLVSAQARPMNGTVHALQLSVGLAHPGSIHYVLVPNSVVGRIRHSLQQAKSVDTLAQMLQDSDGVGLPGVQVGVVETSAEGQETMTEASFSIDGLEDNALYSIVLIPETTSSFGVFGTPFPTLLEAQTNEFASDVSLESVQPTFGSLSSLDICVAMTKPRDVLFVCIEGADHHRNCDEVAREELHLVDQTREASAYTFQVGNLTEDSEYMVAVFAESHLRNGVRSNKTSAIAVKTLRRAPEIVSARAEPVDAHVDAIRISIETRESAKIHYVITKKDVVPEEQGEGDATPVWSAESIVGKHNHNHDETRHSQRDPSRSRHPSHSTDRRPTHGGRDEYLSSAQSHEPPLQVVKRGHALVYGNWSDLLVESLDSNSTFVVHVVTETITEMAWDESAPTGVYGASVSFSTATHDIAPVLVKSTAHALCNRTDGIVVTVNVTRPGVVHYQITNTDFADPTVIRNGLSTDGSTAPHVQRGSFLVEIDGIGMEIKNGTNDTQPMDPVVFANNYTIDGLREDTTYHLSLTTETLGSKGVFGDFPAPILVKTHAPSPEIQADSLRIVATPGSSTALSIQFRLNQLGEVHYAIFFRGIVRDRTTDVAEEEEDQRMALQEIEAADHAEKNRGKNSTDNPYDEFKMTPRWPPPSSNFELDQLTPRLLKKASFDELKGVWENGTISVSRDDVFKAKTIEKKLEKLPPNALFDVCVVPETAASDGVFGSLECRRVATHADYTNQSVRFDEVHVTPVAGTTDGIHIQLLVSKLLDAAESEMQADSASRVERATGRIPYFVLVDGHEGRIDFSHNTIAPASHLHHDRAQSPFKLAIPGRGNVVAAGVLDHVTFENDSFVAVERSVFGLKCNHRYFFFFAYETAKSDGVFTKVNPHKHQPNETSARGAESQAIEVTTFERAPQIRKYEAVPTFGNTSRITAKMEIACASCEEAIVHLLIMSQHCSVPSTDVLLQSEGEIQTVELQAKDERDLASCELPLVYRRVDANMTEQDAGGGHHHHHHRHIRSDDNKVRSIVEDIAGTAVLRPNTTYQVLIATETHKSSGVISTSFTVASVTTHPQAPRFTQLLVQPRKGSTTELVLVVELERPGEVHYMLGKWGNPELNVTSVYNVSAKALPSQRDVNFHNYGSDVVRARRSFKLDRPGQMHVEVVDYLVAGTAYDVFVVVETAGDSGIYGDVLSFPRVVTFATPPMLLAHTAFPTPGATDSLSVGFRVEDGVACLVHVSVISSTPWPHTSRVADRSGAFGNRLTMDDRLVARTTVSVDAVDDWRDINVSVPWPGTNYTVFLVTETAGSDGVFGTVATHSGVRSHREPPVPLHVSVRPADARVDALRVDVALDHDDGGHIHYAVLRHRQRFTRSAITAVGRVDVNASRATHFLVDGLQGRTAYDVYLRLETLSSGGVTGEWTSFPVTATTHGPPAELLETVACDVAPSCDALGRHACSREPNTCGECLDGFEGAVGSTNDACRPLEDAPPPIIRITGVRINPRRPRTPRARARLMDDVSADDTATDTKGTSTCAPSHQWSDATCAALPPPREHPLLAVTSGNRGL